MPLFTLTRSLFYCSTTQSFRQLHNAAGHISKLPHATNSVTSKSDTNIVQANNGNTTENKHEVYEYKNLARALS